MRDAGIEGKRWVMLCRDAVYAHEQETAICLRTSFLAVRTLRRLGVVIPGTSVQVAVASLWRRRPAVIGRCSSATTSPRSSG